MWLDKKDLEKARRGRHLARTDLGFLATEILGFDKIDPVVHGPVMDHILKFDKFQGEDRVELGGSRYTPLHPDPAEVLPLQPRRSLLLDPRGWFKTTLNCIAHSVQWILNFPDVSILVVHANLDHAKKNIISSDKGIKFAFTGNERMRWLFPEFCSPMKKDGSWSDLGTMGNFIVPGRQNPFNAPTIEAGGIGVASAGRHYHVIKFTDTVTEQNYLIDTARQKVIDMFDMFDNLLISPRYFLDVEGTCYHFEDLYNGHIIEKELKLPEEKRSYKIFVRGCFKKQPPPGQEERFTPEERDWPYIMRCPVHPNEKGAGMAREKCKVCGTEMKPISRFESHNPTDLLLLDRARAPVMFACQKENDPGRLDGKATFPLSLMRWASREHIAQAKIRYYTMSVDMAESITLRSDFTAITVVGWDYQNRGYVVDAVQGKFLPSDAVDYLIRMYFKWHCVEAKIEKASFNRAFAPLVGERLSRMGKAINWTWLERSNQESKIERILGLEPFYRDGKVWFSTDLNDYVKDQLKKQLQRFPAGHDDLLDSLRDQFEGKDDYGMMPVPKTEKEIGDEAFRNLLYNRQQWNAIHGRPGFLESEEDDPRLTIV
jgi:predicted phage terminase large subunit-like protein